MQTELEDDEDSTGPIQREHVNRTPHSVEQEVLAVSHRSSSDTLSAALNAAEALLGRAKGISEIAKRVAIDWIEHNGDFSVGDIVYSVSYPIAVKCVDTSGCGHELLRKLDGDFDQFLGVLVAQPYKYGAVGTLLDKPAYRSFFVTKSTAKLINGVPERILTRIDTRFTPTRGTR